MEASSAFVSLSLATVFLASTTGILAWLTAMPAYRVVMKPFERRQREIRSGSRDSSHERLGLLSGEPSQTSVASESRSGQIWRIAKVNVVYEVAVAYVYTVTLVSVLLNIFTPMLMDLI